MVGLGAEDAARVAQRIPRIANFAPGARITANADTPPLLDCSRHQYQSTRPQRRCRERSTIIYPWSVNPLPGFMQGRLHRVGVGSMEASRSTSGVRGA